MMRATASNLLQTSSLKRFFSALTDGEKAVLDKLQKSSLKPKTVSVRDTSGGCGTMYQIDVESSAFDGQSVLQQHKMVKTILKEDIAKWHGLSLVTRPVKK